MPGQCGLRRDPPLTPSRQLLGLFDTVYGEPGPDVEIEHHSGDIEQTTNPRLLDAMRQMAKKRDHRFRVDLYRALLDSTCSLSHPTEGESGRSAS